MNSIYIHIHLKIKKLAYNNYITLKLVEPYSTYSFKYLLVIVPKAAPHQKCFAINCEKTKNSFLSNYVTLWVKLQNAKMQLGSVG